MSDDVIAELDAWLAKARIGWTLPLEYAQARALRDEIVALRKGLLTEYGASIIAKARTEALEEAARACDTRAEAERVMRDDARRRGDLELKDAHGDRAHALQEQAAAIRALKEKGDAPVGFE